MGLCVKKCSHCFRATCHSVLNPKILAFIIPCNALKVNTSQISKHMWQCLEQ